MLRHDMSAPYEGSGAANHQRLRWHGAAMRFRTATSSHS